MDNPLRAACYQILKAMMRLLYRKGVAFGEFTQWAKHAYVEVVAQELRRNGDRPTTTRIAAVTGLTRKDVMHLKQDEMAESVPRFNRTLRVLNGWLHDKQFLNQQGQPAILPFRGDASFEQLVQRYSGDMSSFAMLDEMKRVQLIQVLENGSVELLNAAYIPTQNDQAQWQLLGTDVALLINTIDHNFQTTGEERFYQRKVSYNNLPTEAVLAFRALVREDAHQLLLRFNTWLYEHDRDSHPEVEGTGRMQAGVGIYYFEQPVEADHKESVHEK
ncbi:DUF6502 family protein [Thiolinea disciformis]|uniref:DUF6502 family protein n=1 Tax=Thiolinea disciformis TaxID=125614 RepID=UPI00037714BF|nr:DUF6502 family protein [Thiolinea disciformis]